MLFLVALAPRLYVASAWSGEPVWDGHYYHFGAERIAAGFGYSEDVMVNGAAVSHPWCHYPVGYSAFLAPFYKLFSGLLGIPAVLIGPLLNALLGATTAVLVFRIGTRFLSLNRARVAGAITALHPGLILYTGLTMTELLASFLIILILYVGTKFGGWRGAVLAGVLVGLGTLVRPPILLCAVLLAVVVGGALRERALKTGVVVALAVLTVLPWSFRNCRVMDGCAFVSTNGGWNLAIGALTETGRFRALSGEDGCPVVTGQVQQDRCWAKLGRETIADDPLAWLKKMPAKLQHTYNHESFPVAYMAEARPKIWPESRQQAGRQLLTGFHRGLLVLVALAAIRWPHPIRAEMRHWIPATLWLLGVVIFAAQSGGSFDSPMFWLVVLAPLFSLLRLPGLYPAGGIEQYLWLCLLTPSMPHAVFFGDDR